MTAAGLTAPAWADITFSGLNSPSGPGDGNVESELEIGYGDEPNDVDPRATVRVDGGSTLEFDEFYVGSDTGFFGRLFVSGDGTLVRVEESGSTAEPAMQVGRFGDGYLSVDDGATLTFADDASTLSIGDRSSAVGRVEITDTFTFVSIGQNLVVGDQGIARMDIMGGALVRTRDDTSAGVTIGASTGGVGELYVEGAGTRLVVGDDLVVGGLGHGLLVIRDQAIVDADNSGSPNASVGSEGRLTLDGGTLAIDTLTVNGVLEGHGLVRGDGAGAGVVSVGTSGRVAVGTGQLLRIDEDVTNQGVVQVEGGEAEMLEAFANNAGTASLEPGRVVLESGRVRFAQGLTNNGVIAATEGASDIHGDVTNSATGSVIVARDAVATFHDDFTDDGGTIDVLGGGNVIFLGDATFQAATALLIGIDDDPLLSGGAPIEVAGLATLGGDLTVDTPDDYVPTLGDSFTLLEASGGIVGGFASTTLPDLPGNLEFGLLLGATDVSIEVRIETVGFLDGDFNSDGVVDAADYTVWRDGLGVIYGPEDYDAWVANYGQTAAAAQGTSQSVPEPAALLLVALATTLLPRACRR